MLLDKKLIILFMLLLALAGSVEAAERVTEEEDPCKGWNENEANAGNACIVFLEGGGFEIRTNGALPPPWESSKVEGCEGTSPPCTYKKGVLYLPPNAKIDKIPKGVKLLYNGRLWEGAVSCQNGKCNCPDAGGCYVDDGQFRRSLPAGAENIEIFSNFKYDDSEGHPWTQDKKPLPPPLKKEPPPITPPAQEPPDDILQQPGVEGGEPLEEEVTTDVDVVVEEGEARVEETMIRGECPNGCEIEGVEANGCFNHLPDSHIVETAEGCGDEITVSPEFEGITRIQPDESGDIPENRVVNFPGGKLLRGSATFNPDGTVTLAEGSIVEVEVEGGTAIIDARETTTLNPNDLCGDDATCVGIEGNTLSLKSKRKRKFIEEESPEETALTVTINTEDADPDTLGIQPAPSPFNEIVADTTGGNKISLILNNGQEVSLIVFSDRHGIILKGELPPDVDIRWEGNLDGEDKIHWLNSPYMYGVLCNVFEESSIGSSATSFFSFIGKASSVLDANKTEGFISAGEMIKGITHTTGGEMHPTILNDSFIAKGKNYAVIQSKDTGMNYTSIDADGDRRVDFYLDKPAHIENISGYIREYKNYNHTKHNIAPFEISSAGYSLIDFYRDFYDDCIDGAIIGQNCTEVNKRIKEYEQYREHIKRTAHNFLPKISLPRASSSIGRLIVRRNNRDARSLIKQCMNACSKGCDNVLCKDIFLKEPPLYPEDTEFERRRRFKNCVNGVPGYCHKGTECYPECINNK
ncbi:hypothetical protein ACFL6I_23420 [candidate division KSB1 bacterium]